MYSGPKTTIRTCDDMFTVPTGPMTGTDSTNVAPDVRSTYRNNKKHFGHADMRDLAVRQ